MPITYFELWMTRLMGYLPDLSECIVCGRTLNGSRAFFHALSDGLMCADDKRLASSEISAESRTLASRMLRAPVESFARCRGRSRKRPICESSCCRLFNDTWRRGW